MGSRMSPFHAVYAGMALVAAVIAVGGAVAAQTLGDTEVTGAPTTASKSVTAQPTIDCANLTLTPAQTEGPYFRAGSPERDNLIEPGMAGVPVTLTGFVVDTACAPIAGAKLDFWQADARGVYDNSGYTLRGHVYTDEQGAYRITTIVPGEYPGRTPHIHVKAQRPDGPVLTTQLYLPDQPANARDRIYLPQTTMTMGVADDGALTGSYTFVLP